jgi:putative ABC transport system ATP-binding protein
MSNLIKIEEVKKYYDHGVIKALDGVNLEIKEGEFVAIMGPSGSGKSTLLNMIGNLDKPDSGCIYVDGQHLEKIKDAAEYRAKTVGFIFQLHNLIPHLTSLENVLMPMYEGGMRRRERIKRAKELLERVGLSERLKSLPPQLSGGERQRVAIARALANNPKIILADEPTGSVDSKTERKIMELLKNIWETEGTTIVLVTHDKNVANWAQRIVYMLDGKVVNSTEVNSG